MFQKHKIFLSVASFVSQSRKNSQCCKNRNYLKHISHTNGNIFEVYIYIIVNCEFC